MNGPCYSGGPNCGKLDCAWGCAGSVKFTVPTGSVPRVDRLPSGVLYADPRTELERQLLQPAPPPGPMKGLSNLTVNPATLRPYPPDHPNGLTALPDFGVHGAAIQQAVDDYLLMERKARAWDELMRLYERHDTGLIHVDVAKGLVHPAQPSAPAKG